MTNYTPHQKRYFAEQLTLSRPAREIEALASSMSGVRVDLNPHQVEAALFALRSPISNGALLADEVGLGKTIEAGLVLAQFWAERKQRILLILPASLRIQWKTELEEKFSIPCVIIERPKRRRGAPPPANPFLQATHDKKVAICSYEFAAASRDCISSILWDLVIIDEAHRLRNIYKKTGNARARSIKQALGGRKKLLLTATPLQNNLKEMYGLATIIDEHIFGDAAVFAATPIPDLRLRLRNFCVRTLRRDVSETGYIKFTRRQVITRPYTPGDTEQQLYDRMSEYLQRDHIRALPDNGRQLVTMVIRKLLASSSAAISKTLQSLINKLEALREGYDDNLEADLSEDFEAYGEYSEEYNDEDETDDEAFNAGRQRDRQEIIREQELLRSIKALADSISHDAKGDDLLTALQAGFTLAEESVMQVDGKKGARKAVIFTESTRTQQYVLGLLNEGGYEGQVVLLNGSNNDEISKRIYAEWKERHKDDGLITPSKAANMKAAIVEEFRDRATILIGTEAAAEGINLQFCNMVVNYDLPWNPQRVEQRIGRCHRYGQRYDVVVVNFVNQNNAADRRVYELLESKFRLFEGVFGSSDEVLGALERGIDFERAVYDIVQNCRGEETINRAFDALQQQYADIIEEQRAQTIQQVMEFFDEDVTAKLRDCETRTRASLAQFDRWKYDLFAAHGATRVNDRDWTFDYQGKRYIPSWENAKAGDAGVFLESESPIYTELRDAAAALATPTVRIRFNHSTLPLAEQRGFFRNGNAGLTGAVSVDKLTYNYGKENEKEEHLLISVVTDSGVEIDDDLFGQMMEIPAEVIGTAAAPDDRLDERKAILQARKCAEIDEANKESLVLRLGELEAWRNDCEDALSREINDLRSQIKLKQGQMTANVGSLTFQQIVDLQEEINKLNEVIVQKQRQMLKSKDEIKKSAADLQAEAIRQLNGKATLESIMTFSFEIA
ncbi:MAG: SNF2-related protein [Clostridia bacterium]|nr:SNF2-related protein [Clostridia bacterium]